MTTEERTTPWDDLRAIADRIDVGGLGPITGDADCLREIADSMEDQYEHMRDHQ